MRFLGLAAASVFLLAPSAAFASAGSPSGVNVGFGFDWTADSTNSSAVFLQNDGTTLSDCGTFGTAACDLIYTVSIDGTVNSSRGDISTLPAINVGTYDETANNSFCNSYSPGSGTSLLTNFNCFNSNSYGQAFTAATSGQLTDFSMEIICKAGATLPFWAVLFEAQPDASAIVGDPIASQKIDLTGCLSTWQNYTITSADFTRTSMDFGSPALTQGKVYVVLFAGDAVAGTQVVDVTTLAPPTPAPPPPYSGPTVGPITDRVRAGEELRIPGDNLSGVTEVRIGELVLPIISVDDKELLVKVPNNAPTGESDLTIISDSGRLTVQDGVDVSESEDSQPKGWTCSQNNGSVRVIFKNPVGHGKVQFLFNGKEIAWVDAEDDDDEKLRHHYVDGLRVPYLVREVELEDDRKNVFEIYVDGERHWRSAYVNHWSDSK